MTDRGNPEPPPRTPLEHIFTRAKSAGMNPSYITEDDGDVLDDPVIGVEFPRGRAPKRVRYLTDERCARLLGEDFEQIVFLGDYDAFANRATGVIEAVLSAPNSPKLMTPSISRLVSLPGVEDLSQRSNQATDGQSEDSDHPLARFRDIPEEWILRLVSPEDEAVSIELGSASSLLDALMWGSKASIRIKGADVSSHDQALAALERFGNALLFELDMVYGVLTRLSTRRARIPRPRRKMPDRVPRFPRNKYAQQSLALYQYGRSAANLPLLEYLAYYQAIEYFFPYFAREQTLTALKSVLMDPAFDPSEDTDLTRILDMSSGGGRALMPEREQLRATISACVSDSDIRTFITSDSVLNKYLTDKDQKVRGVEPLRLNRTAEDLRQQVADRVYALRCRIVHAKQDGGGSSSPDVLLPVSAEADAMGPDIEIVRWLAQKVLIGRAVRS